MILSVNEVLDILITIVVGAYIFMDQLSVPGHRTFGERLMFAAAIVGPAIVLHEFGHKFVALALGLTATFHAAYLWLGIGVVLKLLSSPIIFLVPAFVTIAGPGGMSGLYVALAGPLINGLLWLIAFLALKFGSYSTKTTAILGYTQMINGFLFIFNLLPIPGFDGYHAVRYFMAA